MLSVWLTESEEAASTPTPNTVVYLGKLDTGLVCKGHLTRLELGSLAKSIIVTSD